MNHVFPKGIPAFFLKGGKRVPGQPVKIAILGGGRGGSDLLEVLTRSAGTEILGIADKDPNAPGLRRARELNIPVMDNVVSLISNDEADLIIDVTGDPAMEQLISERKAPGVEVLGGSAARLLWYVVQHDAHMHNQLLQAEKLATIGTFTSGIAHEINNPLYFIMGLAEDMGDEEDLAVIRGHARSIVLGVQRISTIVKGLTGYTRVTSAEDLSNVELNSKLDEAVRLAQYATVLNDIVVVRGYTACPMIKAKPEEIVQLFVNLITNAVQAMDGKGTLSLSTHCENNTVTVSISDTGPGISKGLINKIYDPFFTTKEPGKGTGLGLHIVQTIVRRYGGQISVASEEGKGAAFQLQFPRSGSGL